MPEAVEAEEIHFFHGLLRGPLLEGHAIGGHEHASAIVTETAVDENLLSPFAAKQRQELNDLFIGWGRPATDGDMDKAHTKRLGEIALPCDFFTVLPAELPDGGDGQNFQFPAGPVLRLVARG